jgi:hypothetical protein
MIAIFVLTTVLLQTGGQAMAPWPAEVLEGLAMQLAERLEPTMPKDPAVLADARTRVQGVRERLDRWGEKGVVDRAPSFPDLALPTAGQVHLDAMARYQVCTLALAVRLNDTRSDQERRQLAGGVTAITMAIVSLRHPYLERGHSPDQIRSFITGGAMERATAALLKGDAAVRRHVDGKCAAVIKALVEPA